VTELPDPETFLSGEHGEVGGRRGALRRAGDRALDAWLATSGTLRALDAAAARTPSRAVLVACVYRGSAPPHGEALRSERHRVELAFGSLDELGGGKFGNLNLLIGEARADWLAMVDDDVVLPQRFLDRAIALAEVFDLALVQPAQSLASHAAWAVTRRRPFSVLRETRFVEIGPVTLFRRDVAAELLPFPSLRYGWGLDLHWSALAAERGWRLGIVDALPVRHESGPVGSGYSSDAAIEEAQGFLAERPYLPSAAAGQVVKLHR
jgi:hypothetical protein